MKKLIELDIDPKSERAQSACSSCPNIKSFKNLLQVSPDGGEYLLKSEIEQCTAPEVYRFRIFGEDVYGSRVEYTKWVVNREIYPRTSLIKMGILLSDDANDRYFLTSDGKPIPLGKDDESFESYYKRTKKGIKKKEEQEPCKDHPPADPLYSWGPLRSSAPQKRSYKKNNPESVKPVKPVVQQLPPISREVEQYVEIQKVPNSPVVREYSFYAKVKGRNVLADFANDELVKYFCEDDIIRTRFFTKLTITDHIKNAHTEEKYNISGWIYNGEAYDFCFAYMAGMIDDKTATELCCLRTTRVVVTKCGRVYPLNQGDKTFDEYSAIFATKDGIARKKD